MDLGKRRIKRGRFREDHEEKAYPIPIKIPVTIPEKESVPLIAPKEVNTYGE